MKQQPWALIVSTSRYFFNYRHATSALSVYAELRRRSVPDSQIVLMLAGSMPCDIRNAQGGHMFQTTSKDHDLYPASVQVDYSGSEVTVEAFLGVLADRLPPGTAASRRLRSGPRDRVLLYLTGHGGEEFLKFGDQFELNAGQLATAVTSMFRHRRCGELLLIVDTCQAATLAARLGDYGLTDDFPVRVLSLASSDVNEKSYSLDVDRMLGVAISDRFTFHLQHIIGRERATTLDELETQLRHSRLLSTVVHNAYGWGAGRTPELAGFAVSAFFGHPSTTPARSTRRKSACHSSVQPPGSFHTAPIPPRKSGIRARWRCAEARLLGAEASCTFASAAHAASREGESDGTTGLNLRHMIQAFAAIYLLTFVLIWMIQKLLDQRTKARWCRARTESSHKNGC